MSAWRVVLWEKVKGGEEGVGSWSRCVAVIHKKRSWTRAIELLGLYVGRTALPQLNAYRALSCLPKRSIHGLPVTFTATGDPGHECSSAWSCAHHDTSQHEYLCDSLPFMAR